MELDNHHELCDGSQCDTHRCAYLPENIAAGIQWGDELTRLVNVARQAAEGDSNDAEIEALQDALDEALSLLGREDLR